MNWSYALTPTNLAEEKAKFLADTSYNPQFSYPEVTLPKKLQMYGLPKPEYLELAQEILDKAYFGRNYMDLMMNEGRAIGEQEVTQKFETFLKMHGLENRYKIVWSASFVSRASIDSDTIKLRKNAEFHEEGLLGVIYHEVGTHALRRINYEQQPWFKRKKEFGISQLYLPTEEGLATLHFLLPKGDISLYSTALRYMASAYAQTHSFSELWNFLGQYIQDVDTQWQICFRQKKGLQDTSEGGGFTKDIVYFEGAIKVWKWLDNHDYQVDDLYIGKIGIEDLDKVKNSNPGFLPLLPSFYVTDKNAYANKIAEIGQFNKLDQVKLYVE